MNMNKEACHCAAVTYAMIEEAIKNGASTYEEVQRATGCGRSCGRCREFLQFLIKDMVKEIQG